MNINSDIKPCIFLPLIIIIFILSICVYNVPFAIVEHNHCKTYKSGENQPTKTYFILGKGLCPSYSKFSVVAAAENTTNAATNTTAVVSFASGRTTTSSSVIIYNNNNDDNEIIQNIDYKNCAPILDTSYTIAMVCFSSVFFYIFVYVYCECTALFCPCCDFIFNAYYTINDNYILKNLYFVYFVLFLGGFLLWNIGLYFVLAKNYWRETECRNYTSDGFNIHISNSILMFILSVYSFIKYMEIYVLPASPTPNIIERERPTPLLLSPPPLHRQEPTQLCNMKHIQKRIGNAEDEV